MKYKPKTIDEIGLEKYLNQTIDKHNGFTYDGFINMIKTDVNQTNIARAFKVDRRTVSRWIEVYHQEQENG